MVREQIRLNISYESLLGKYAYQIISIFSEKPNAVTNISFTTDVFGAPG